MNEQDRYQRNREKILSRLAEQRRINPEAVKQYEREQYQKHKENRKVRDHARYLRGRHKFYARKAVKKQVDLGLLLPACECLCAECGNQASDYHHPSYLPDDYLRVIPLCRSCHVKAHHDKKSPLIITA